jgi:hypothetical protein
MNDEFDQRLRAIESLANKFKTPTARRDINTMIQTVQQARTAVSREAVECRRIRKITARYAELENKYIQLLTELEEYTTFGLLANA